MSKLRKALEGLFTQPQLNIDISVDGICCTPSDTGETAHFPCPSLTLTDGQAMAELLDRWLKDHYKPRKVHVQIFVNTRKTVLRLSDSLPISSPFLDMPEYVSNGGTINGKHIMAALPLAIVNAITEMALLLGIDLHHIKGIDCFEHRLLQDYGANAHYICVCLPQEQGFRLLLIDRGVPSGIYFVSGDPLYRENELNRIWRFCQPLPSYAVLLAPCPWLHEYFTARMIEMIE